MVLVLSYNSGLRLETYVMAGKRGSRTVFLNGPATRLIKKGEEIIVMGLKLTNKKIKPNCFG